MTADGQSLNGKSNPAERDGPVASWQAWGGFLVSKPILFWAVLANEVSCPIEKVYRSLSRRLSYKPQLQVLWPVVVANAVDVMDVLAETQVPSEGGLHY